MTKVKFIQISLAMNKNQLVQGYLDDKGRVWYREEVYNRDDNGVRIKPFFEWKLIELPEEPEE